MRDEDYFALRRAETGHMAEPDDMPAWLEDLLPGPKERILDIGCGLGHVLNCLRKKGYGQVTGVDIDRAAVSHCLDLGLDVQWIRNVEEFSRECQNRFDLIIMLHVLEHIDKGDIIESLRAVRSLLAPGGSLVVSVPNAQSPTGCYWAFEDFTHSTIFTAGSLYHVLTAAGFSLVELIDPHCLAGLPWPKRFLRRWFLALYDQTKNLINRGTASSWHEPSPRVYSFEVKAIARNP
jgi:2-polyprenyl-3-methyl-5-hydroxy-6-metoxy-1,4-benzoquinol methylase